MPDTTSVLASSKHPYFRRWVRMWSSRVLRMFAKASGTPHQIALGAALGVFIAFTPTIGFQMLLGVIVATIFRANPVAAALPAWLTNPVTIVPVYSFNYWVGTLFYPGPDVSELKAGLHAAMKAATDATGWWDGCWAFFKVIMDLGLEILIPLWLGCCIVGAILGVLTYPIMKRAVEGLRDKISRKREALHRRVAERMASATPPEGTQL